MYKFRSLNTRLFITDTFSYLTRTPSRNITKFDNNTNKNNCNIDFKIAKLRHKLQNDTSSLNNNDIVYLRQPGVIEWIYGESKFISSLTKKKEDEWGRNIIGYTTNQWTTRLGESILKEILLLLGKNPSRVKTPMKSANGKKLLPDFEADDGMYENKARTYMTTGTAGEKILAVPMKYCEIPRLYKKPLYVVCMAYQEHEACKCFQLFEPKSEELQEMLELFENKWQIKYIRATELLEQYLQSNQCV